MIAGLPMHDVAWLVIALLFAGAMTGFLAGLFGVGGGAVLVPALYELFRIVGVPDDVRMPLCVGTSLAIIIPTSIRSYYAHRATSAVDTSVLRNWAVVCAANFAGAAGLALLVWWSGQAGLHDGQVGTAAVRIALAKARLPPGEAFFRGVLCNV